MSPPPAGSNEPDENGSATAGAHGGVMAFPDRTFGPVSGSVSGEYRELLGGLETILTEAARRVEAPPGAWLPGPG